MPQYKGCAMTTSEPCSGPCSETRFLRKYIQSLVRHLDHSLIPKQVSIVFDGGAFNGGFGAGVALYLKEMERIGLFQVKRISGCSVGALLAVWYMLGCDDRILTFVQQLYTTCRQTMTISGYNTFIQSFIYDVLPTDALVKSFHKKLYINYYDTQSGRQRVVSRFRNRQHLVQCMVRSAHIPFLTDGQVRCDKRYIDGMLPYLLGGDSNRLFVNLVTLRKFSRAFIIKSEQNIHYRLLAGVSDANEFFTIGTSDICSYIDQWTYFFKGCVTLRSSICLLVLFLIESLLSIINKLPLCVTDNILCTTVHARIKALVMECITNRLF